MSKRERDFAEIATYKARFQALPTETLQARLATGSLFKAAAIAIRELLEERGDATRTEGQVPPPAI